MDGVLKILKGKIVGSAPVNSTTTSYAIGVFDFEIVIEGNGNRVTFYLTTERGVQSINSTRKNNDGTNFVTTPGANNLSWDTNTRYCLITSLLSNNLGYVNIDTFTSLSISGSDFFVYVVLASTFSGLPFPFADWTAFLEDPIEQSTNILVNSISDVNVQRFNL